MSSCVLDSSAVLAYLHNEPGGETTAGLLDEAAISAVNAAEVGAKLSDDGASEDRIRRIFRDLDIEITDFDETLSYRVAALRQATRGVGLSLGDRACLATAQRLGVRAVTADRKWSSLNVGVQIQVIR